MPKQSRKELDARVDYLSAQMSEILALEDKDQMDGFAGMADQILEASGPDDRDHIWSRLQCLLRENGLLPGDDEPCSE